MFVLHRPVCSIFSKAVKFWNIIATAAPSANCEESQHESKENHVSSDHCSPEYTASCNVDAPAKIR